MAGKKYGLVVLILILCAAVAGYYFGFTAGMRQGIEQQPPALTSKVPAPQPGKSAETEMTEQRRALEQELSLPEAEMQPVLETEKPVAEHRREEEPADAVPVLNLDNLAGTMVLTVPGLREGGKLPLAHTCYQSNVSPPLEWSGVPEGTQSFVVFLENRMEDAGEKLYWVVFDVPGTRRDLPADVRRAGIQGLSGGRSDHNNTGYVGPCDPRGGASLHAGRFCARYGPRSSRRRAPT